jgi:hypothetical protein
VLSGRIPFGELVLQAGDFLKVGPGEEHDAHAFEDSLFLSPHRGGVMLKG